jgi:hypothetical protein
MSAGVHYAAPHSNIRGTAGNRKVERDLLFLVGLYSLAGMLTLYLGVPGARGILAVPAGLSVAAAFLAVHYYWNLSGYRGDRFLLPVTAVLISTGWSSFSGWTLPMACVNLYGL